VDHDPSKEARAARKAHMAKNEQQRLKNLARSQHGQPSTATATKAPGALSERKGEIARTLAMTRSSTASMGKFDRMLEGEKKPRGGKRKVKRIPHITTSSSRVLNASVFFICLV
jgi:regulator of ribosome biosynthesis